VIYRQNFIKKQTCFNSEFFIRFAEMIDDSFNTMLLMQMLGCSMQLCFQCLQAFMVSHRKEGM